jgi:tubulin polyglutamylase TTLL6/13
MLDHKLKPWMLEVNHMPSFRADTDIDYDIKHDLILNTLRILQLGTEQRRQQEVILKQEQKLAMQYGNVKRMTAQEHCLRVRFDHTLVEQYVPNNKYKRIYPLDPGRGGSAANGDDLEEVYAKLDKAANMMWRK